MYLTTQKTVNSLNKYYINKNFLSLQTRLLFTKNYKKLSFILKSLVLRKFVLKGKSRNVLNHGSFVIKEIF